MNVDPDHFLRDVLADCMVSALASQWRERAQEFRNARPRPGDFPGRQTIEERRATWRRLTAIAEICDRHADVIERGGAGIHNRESLLPELEAMPIWEAA